MSNTKSKQKGINIKAMDKRHIGLTPSIGGGFYESASVCLDRHHESPVEFEVICNDKTCSRHVEFEKPDDRTKNAWANDIDATEYGAYCVCLAAVESEENLVAVKRAETLTGADWYIAPAGVDIEDLEQCFRLEVSGTDQGNKNVVETRLKNKIDQTRRGASNLPAIASVVGFKAKTIMIEKVSNEL